MLYNIISNINESTSNLDFWPKLQPDMFNCLLEISIWTQGQHGPNCKNLYQLLHSFLSSAEPISLKCIRVTWGSSLKPNSPHWLNPPSPLTSNLSPATRLRLILDGLLALCVLPLCTSLGEILSTSVLECHNRRRNPVTSGLMPTSSNPHLLSQPGKPFKTTNLTMSNSSP